MTSTPGRNPTLLPRTPHKKPTATSKALKTSARPPTKYSYILKRRSFQPSRPVQGYHNPYQCTTDRVRTATIHILFRSFRSICCAPRHHLLLMYNGNCSKIISTNFQEFVFAHPPSKQLCFRPGLLPTLCPYSSHFMGLKIYNTPAFSRPFFASRPFSSSQGSSVKVQEADHL